MAKLNAQQRAAVTLLDYPLLVIAGAGSGKTLVITEKIAHLIRQGLPARHITAVTFTNKAAREMQSRAAKMLPDRELRGLTISTFHALGLDILRREHAALGFKANISILDDHDRCSVLKGMADRTGAQPDLEDISDHATLISRWKNRFVNPAEAIAQASSDEQRSAARLYAGYCRVLKAYNAVDFDDLILLPVSLFAERPEILEKWRQRIRYLLVDEYQDANETQYQLVKHLSGNLGRFTVVGDDDQSVYGWRGAQPENLAQLARDYPRLKVITLEQNYRSTGKILKAANRLIANNPHVFEKKLWSALGHGDPIRVMRHADEIAEARQIAADIMHHKFRHGAGLRDYAILYRSNHQARLFERALRECSLPYHINGGSSFFDRAEVKDLLAYIRLMVNHEDDAAFLRIVNVPKREIGSTTLEKLGEYAQRRHVSLFDACLELGLQQTLPENVVHRLRNFCARITDVANSSRCADPFRVLEEFLSTIGFEQWLRESSSGTAMAERRMANVRELLAWLQRIAAEETKPKSLSEAVSKVMLLDLLDRQDEEQTGDRVHLVTLHAAKGLEFPYVYLVGMEENLLPHQTSIAEGAIEEERRLAYVGITRARKQLTLSYCTKRRRYGELLNCEPSRFLEELPLEDLEWPDRQPIDAETKKERGRASLAQLRSLLSEA